MSKNNYYKYYNPCSCVDTTFFFTGNIPPFLCHWKKDLIPLQPPIGDDISYYYDSGTKTFVAFAPIPACDFDPRWFIPSKKKIKKLILLNKNKLTNFNLII